MPKRGGDIGSRLHISGPHWPRRLQAGTTGPRSQPPDPPNWVGGDSQSAKGGPGVLSGNGPWGASTPLYERRRERPIDLGAPLNRLVSAGGLKGVPGDNLSALQY